MRLLPLLLLAACAHRAPEASVGPTVDEALARVASLVREERCGEAIAIVDAMRIDAPRSTARVRYVATRAPGAGGAVLAALSGPQGAGETVVISAAWADLLFARAVCAVNLGRPGEAAGDLKQAMEYLPGDVVLSCELGYVFAAEGDFEASLAQYRTAWTDATRLEGMPGFEEARAGGGPLLWGESLTAWKARALRGQGYALIELGRLDEAEVIYRSILEFAPEDPNTLQELEYIRKVRAEGAPGRG